mmetsp:Transcript_29176/g.93213  ORF Transcript_29176/g.93213 Transcript_29176/m.93213 type:complete len:211 (-) Transcript_29176:2085-2717(-)
MMYNDVQCPIPALFATALSDAPRPGWPSEGTPPSSPSQRCTAPGPLPPPPPPTPTRLRPPYATYPPPRKLLRLQRPSACLRYLHAGGLLLGRHADQPVHLRGRWHRCRKKGREGTERRSAAVMRPAGQAGGSQTRRGWSGRSQGSQRGIETTLRRPSLGAALGQQASFQAQAPRPPRASHGKEERGGLAQQGAFTTASRCSATRPYTRLW